MLDTYFRRHPIIIDDNDKSIDKKEVSFAATISLIFAARTIDSYCQLHLVIYINNNHSNNNNHNNIILYLFAEKIF